MTDREAILATISSFIDAYNRGDLAGVLASYDDDLVKVRQGAAPETKTETAIRLKDVFERFDSHVEVVNSELEVSGDLAFARGSFVVTLAPRSGGDTVSLSRRFLEIWRRVGGRWRVLRTMDNTP